MPDKLCEFTNEGIAAFTKWLHSGAPGNVPDDLLGDAAFSNPLCETGLLVRERFPDRYAFGNRLAKLLSLFDAHTISYKRGLWAWLAAWYFDQLCEIDASGKRILRKEYVYVPQNERLYYRHLVRTPWYVVSQHGELAKFLLISTRADDPAPLSRQSYPVGPACRSAICHLKSYSGRGGTATIHGQVHWATNSRRGSER